MCHGCSKDHNNKTWLNASPLSLTLDEYKKIIPQRNKIKQFFCMPEDQCFKNPIEFVFSSAESTLNPELYAICKYTKELYPNCYIRLISNGTVPPVQPDIVKYIDRIGFSIDGCSKEVFEKLRTPAKFEKVMDVLKEWEQAGLQYNEKFTFGFGTVVSTVNFHELAGIVHLASSFKIIDSIWLQPIFIHEQLKHLDYMLLEHLEHSLGVKYFNEALLASAETGVRLDMPDSFKSIYQINNNETASTSPSTANVKQNDFDPEKNRYCDYLFNNTMIFSLEGPFRHVCCYMNVDNSQAIMKKYKIPTKGSPFHIYNSKQFWQLRKDMLEGKCLEYCSTCTYGNSGYYSMLNK